MMCIGDWRFGRLIRSQATGFSLTVGQVFTVPADPNRVGIDIFLSLQGVPATGFISMDGVELFAEGGFGSDFLHFDLTTHGDAPTRTWSVTRVTNTLVGAVIEYFAPADYLAAGLQEFETQYGKFLTSRR